MCFPRRMKMLEVRSYVFALVIAVALAVVSGCSTAPVTGRSQFTGLVSQSEEVQLGLTAFDQMKKEVPISKDPAANALLQKVGPRIAKVAANDLPNAQWEFVVFDSKEINAFCLPGGKIGVYTGILPITKDEDGLATVIGHEVAHAAAHHGAERMSQATVMQAGGQIVGAGVAKSSATTQQVASTLWGLGSQVGVLLPYSRKHESEADEIGLVYMARAGYRPEKAVEFWQRFAAFNKQQGSDSTPWFMRTHPVDDTRIQQLKQWLPKAQAEYRPPN